MTEGQSSAPAGSPPSASGYKRFFAELKRRVGRFFKLYGPPDEVGAGHELEDLVLRGGGQVKPGIFVIGVVVSANILGNVCKQGHGKG